MSLNAPSVPAGSCRQSAKYRARGAIDAQVPAFPESSATGCGLSCAGASKEAASPSRKARTRTRGLSTISIACVRAPGALERPDEQTTCAK